MGHWVYKLELEGTQLRKMIDEENDSKEHYAAIILYLRTCLEVIKKQAEDAGDESDVDEIDELYNLLDGDDTIILGDDIESYDFENSQELVDSRLEDFYDLCDSIRCFIAL